MFYRGILPVYIGYMSNLPPDPKARRKTVSLTLNSELLAKAKAEGLNISRIAEEAVSEALTARMREKLREEIRQDMDIYNDFVQRHGSPAQALRDYLEKRGDAV